jgi:ribosome maturation factor RimP
MARFFILGGSGVHQMDSDQRGSLGARISSLAEQVAGSLGMEIVLAEIKGGGNRSIVRIFIDQPGGISLSDCERFSKRFSVMLDVEDFLPFSYVLEVSSPGLDRPLVKEKDFEHFSGRAARIRTRAPMEGQRNFKGKILGVVNGRVSLEIEPGKQVEIAIVDMEKANLVIEI